MPTIQVLFTYYHLQKTDNIVEQWEKRRFERDNDVPSSKRHSPTIETRLSIEVHEIGHYYVVYSLILIIKLAYSTD
jgi:hypothetical protein